MDGDSPDLAVHELALAGVEAGAHLDSEPAHALRDRARAADRPRRAVEAREEAVTGRVELLAAEAGELGTDDPVVVGDELFPPAVAELGCLLRRVDDVGEEHRGELSVDLDALPDLGEERLDLGEGALRVAQPREVVRPRQLDTTGERDPLRDVAAAPRVDEPVVDPVKYQRRHTD